MIDKEMVDSIKDAIDSLGVTTYGGAWDSSLVEGVNGERYHAITNNNDVVVRADGDNRHSSWLCDYLGLVSPVNMLKLIAQLESAQKELSAANEKPKPISFDELADRVQFVTGGLRMSFDPLNCKGHQIVPFMNFNSLSRIVEMYRTTETYHLAGFTVEGNTDAE
ncbi:hypothetical protein ACVSTV_13025 [Yersinia enterocolitica]